MSKRVKLQQTKFTTSKVSTKQETHDRIRLEFDEDGLHLRTFVDGEPEPIFLKPLHEYLGIEPFDMLDPANEGRLNQIDPDDFRAASARAFPDGLRERAAWLRARGIDPDIYMEVIDEQRQLGVLDETEVLPS